MPGDADEWKSRALYEEQKRHQMESKLAMVRAALVGLADDIEAELFEAGYVRTPPEASVGWKGGGEMSDTMERPDRDPDEGEPVGVPDDQPKAVPVPEVPEPAPGTEEEDDEEEEG